MFGSSVSLDNFSDYTISSFLKHNSKDFSNMIQNHLNVTDLEKNNPSESLVIFADESEVSELTKELDSNDLFIFIVQDSTKTKSFFSEEENDNLAAIRIEADTEWENIESLLKLKFYNKFKKRSEKILNKAIKNHQILSKNAKSILEKSPKSITRKLEILDSLEESFMEAILVEDVKQIFLEFLSKLTSFSGFKLTNLDFYLNQGHYKENFFLPIDIDGEFEYLTVETTKSRLESVSIADSFLLIQGLRIFENYFEMKAHLGQGLPDAQFWEEAFAQVSIPIVLLSAKGEIIHHNVLFSKLGLLPLMVFWLDTKSRINK